MISVYWSLFYSTTFYKYVSYGRRLSIFDSNNILCFSSSFRDYYSDSIYFIFSCLIFRSSCICYLARSRFSLFSNNILYYLMNFSYILLSFWRISSSRSFRCFISLVHVLFYYSNVSSISYNCLYFSNILATSMGSLFAILFIYS